MLFGYFKKYIYWITDNDILTDITKLKIRDIRLIIIDIIHNQLVHNLKTIIITKKHTHLKLTTVNDKIYSNKYV
jgi:hypothetical protein